MPSVSPRKASGSSPRKAARVQYSNFPPASQKLRPADPHELDSWGEGDSEGAHYYEPQPHDLDEPWEYSFRPGEEVWVRTVGGNWHSGKVCGQTTRIGQTRKKEGLFYPVVFSDRIRKYFAPLNGEIKPDTPYIRNLLRDAGWL